MRLELLHATGKPQSQREPAALSVRAELFDTHDGRRELVGPSQPEREADLHLAADGDRIPHLDEKPPLAEVLDDGGVADGAASRLLEKRRLAPLLVHDDPLVAAVFFLGNPYLGLSLA